MPVTQALPDGPYATGTGTPGQDAADIVAFLTQKGTATDTEILAASQPVDSDLTAIAALTTAAYGRALLALADAAAGRTNLGLGAAATANVGTTAGTVAAGDDSRLSATATLVPNPALVGKDTYFEGHSYSAGSNSTNNVGYAQRIAARQIFKSVNYRGVAQRFMVDAAMLLRIDTPAGQTGNKTRMYLLDCLYNDINAQSSAGTFARNSARSYAGYQNSLRFWLYVMQGSNKQDTTQGTTYTGTWANDTTSNAGQIQSAINKFTTTQNDFVDIVVNVPDTGKVAVVLWGIDDSNSGMTGAAFTISLGGTTLVTGTTSNQYLRGGNGAGGGGTNWVACPMPVLVTGLTPGSRTLRVTKTDATGSRLWLHGIFAARSTTSVVWQSFVLKQPSVPSQTDTDIGNYNALVDSVVAEFAVSDTSIVVANPGTLTSPSLGAWNPATMVNDTIHPNDRGHAFYTDVVNGQLLNGLAFANYLNTL